MTDLQQSRLGEFQIVDDAAFQFNLNYFAGSSTVLKIFAGELFMP